MARHHRLKQRKPILDSGKKKGGTQTTKNKRTGPANHSKKHVPSKPRFQKGNADDQEDKHKKKKKVTWKGKGKKEESDDGSDFEEVSALLTKYQPQEDVDSTDTDSDEEIKETRKLVTQQNRKKKKSGGFQSMGFCHQVYTGIIRKGYKIPTPIQRKTIPLILEGKDVVAMARTGSGKTAAFLLPMFEKLKMHTAKAGARALIMSPTRELALQTLTFTKELGKFTGLKAAVILGGDKMDDQFSSLHENPDIIIATPGRLLHVLVEMNLRLMNVEYVVFDEADRLFEMGFQEQLLEIIHRLPESRQTLLFSATLPKLLVEFAKAGLHDPTLLRLDVETKLSNQLKMSFFHCREEEKQAILLHILKNVIEEDTQSVIFVATKHHVEYVNLLLEKAGIDCSYIYSSLDQTARKINIAKFQLKKVKVLLVTDLAARGIDIPLLDNVINYNFPAKSKLFVHRVGRVARAGRSGTAFSLVAQDEVPYLIDLHVFLGRQLKMVTPRTGKDEEGLYGCVPQTIADEMNEKIRIWMSESIDLENLKKVSLNAQKKYVTSRQAPASESLKRFKELNRNGVIPGVHPIFGELIDDSGMERINLLNSLKTYKSNTTIFEVNSTAKTPAFSVMKSKRGWHQNVIERKNENVSAFQQKSLEKLQDERLQMQETVEDNELESAFSKVIGGKESQRVFKPKEKKRKFVEIKDEENYLNYRPSDFQTERGFSMGTSFDKESSAVQFDIAGDDDDAIKKFKTSARWDRKKKKFVKEDNNDPKKKKIRTESGAWIPASYKSNAYKEWQNKNKVDEAEADSDNNEGDREDRGYIKVLGGKGRKWHTQGQEGSKDSSKNGKFKRPKQERKRPEQIMKSRNAKAKKQAFQKHQEQTRQKRKNFSSQMSKKKGRR
ncbi:ATP-dependent RNA helicase DDX54-like [Mizuhopecten yessoensis]|uniref:ATP-dependent RNA helicase DDX54 n=1 Tax=Mizuhopecten yessoensis TaxID=6573 RepID=A0A210PHQ1_MIZYE|nr:ATP-dependent RNA helicase DDX54-like [Mizuhopecten yessoensis]OWF35956.1 ATP-dependent RNA helicase DDX54 [Mizuhopecten yessoensis]